MELFDTHFADESVLVDGSALLPVGKPRRLRPHLLDIFQHHVAMSVKSLDAGEKLPVVATGDQDLGVASDSGLKDRQGAGAELVLFEKGDLVFSVLGRVLA